jgi:hypothetical protein
VTNVGDILKGLGKEHLSRVKEVISDPVLLRVLRARRENHRDTLEGASPVDANFTAGRAQEMKWLLEILPQSLNRMLGAENPKPGVDTKPKGGIDE